MNFIFLYIWTFFTILISPSRSFSPRFSEFAAPFCFNPDDPNCGPYSRSWDGLCQTGIEQSPIDIITKNHTDKFGKIKFSKSYSKALDHFFIRNNGQTILFGLPSKKQKDFQISGTGLKGKYIFGSGHFHWSHNDGSGSEHTLNGVPAQLELHLIHHAERFANLNDAKYSEDRDALAVIGILFEIGDSGNPELEKIVESMNLARNPTDEYIQIDTEFHLEKILPRPKQRGDHIKVFKYLGSLTTPPCSENVIWLVFKDPIIISRDQIEAFRDLRNDKGKRMEANFRPLQSLNDRKSKGNLAEFA